MLISGWSAFSQLLTRDDTFYELRPYEIFEELPLQTLVGNIFADSRLDEAEVKGVGLLASDDSPQFEILSATIPDLFRIESPTGFLRVNSTIDRDAICFKKTNCSVHLDVQISSNLLIRLVRVTVNILDVNDNPPTFSPSRLVLNVSESTVPGRKIVLPTSAEDLDSGRFGLLRHDYSSNSSRLRLVVGDNSEAAEGELYLLVAERLDREENAVYRLQVTATDGGDPARSGSLDVTVYVDDANDNAPQFDRDVYDVSVREDFPLNRPFVRLHAVDLDDGANARVVYGLARSSVPVFGSRFHVDGQTGDVSLRQALDYRREQQCVLSIVAVDSGSSPVAVYARVVVSVVDVNDNSPTIKVKSDLYVVEAEPPGVLVGHVSVNDLDSGRNGQVHCWISQSEFLLEKLHSRLYKITTNGTFDREQRQDFRPTIQCEDAGQPSRTAAETVTVRIVDVNDNDPVFAEDVYSVSVKENNAVGVPLMRISARDADTGENAVVAYSLGGNARGLIAVDADTGIVTTAGVFDHETIARYEFVATAADRGRAIRRSATATIVLSVVDFNDEAPRFLRPSYSFGTYENQPPETEIGTVTAHDADAPPFDRFTFSVVRSRPAANLFRVDPNSGKIVSVRVLDREQYLVHYLVLAVTNVEAPNPSSLVNVTISVADRNDNAPLIEYPSADNCTIELPGDVIVGAVVARVIARDADFGQNARLEYSIAKGNDRNAFEMNPISGVLTLKRPIPAAQQRTVTRYSLLLAVKDSGEPEKSATALLEVYVNKTTGAGESGRTKSSVGHSSPPSFKTNFDALFSFEVIIILSAIMAALMMILVVVIVYIRRRNRAVVDRNLALSSSSKASPRRASPCSLPKYLVRKPEVCNNEYTYCAAESVDAKDYVANTLRLSTDDYTYDGVDDDAERPRTHYTFAKVSNETAQGSLVREPLLSNNRRSPYTNMPLNTIAASNSRTSPPNTGDVEFHRLLEVLRRGADSDSCECLSHCSTHSNLDSGRGPSETEIDHFQNSQNALRAVLPSSGGNPGNDRETEA